MGTSSADHVERNLAALDLALTAADLEEIDAAAPLGAAAGNRYPDSYMPRLGL